MLHLRTWVVKRRIDGCQALGDATHGNGTVIPRNGASGPFPGPPPPVSASQLITRTGLNIFRLYSGSDGQTHFEDVGYSMATTRHGLIAQDIAVAEIGLEASTGSPAAQGAFQVSPVRQLVIPLKGRAEVQASDGTTRVLEVGTIMLAEDTSGAGHRVREIEHPRLTLLAPLANKKRAPSGLLW